MFSAKNVVHVGQDRIQSPSTQPYHPRRPSKSVTKLLVIPKSLSELNQILSWNCDRHQVFLRPARIFLDPPCFIFCWHSLTLVVCFVKVKKRFSQRGGIRTHVVSVPGRVTLSLAANQTSLLSGRSDRIRTCVVLIPNQVPETTRLHSDV